MLPLAVAVAGYAAYATNGSSPSAPHISTAGLAWELNPPLIPPAKTPISGVAGIPPPALAETGETPTPPADDGGNVWVSDSRAAAVRRLLAGRPLAAYAELMVGLADTYGFDWRLMPVISMLESSGGVAACGGNAWGLAACRITYGSFEAGAYAVAATLASGYRGLSPTVALCVWVSGGGCTSTQAIEYVYRAAPLWAALGGSLALPPRPAAPAAPLPGYSPGAGEAAEATPVPTTPPPTATTTPSPVPATPSATPSWTVPPATSTPTVAPPTPTATAATSP
ncbi:MAG: hypothetical protein ACM3S1_17075 [Hyphomicrobiales bacterium]